MNMQIPISYLIQFLSLSNEDAGDSIGAARRKRVNDSRLHAPTATRVYRQERWTLDNKPQVVTVDIAERKRKLYPLSQSSYFSQ